MREQLIEGSEGLYLQKARGDNACTYSDNTIPKGTHGISVRQEVDGSTYLAWVSIGSVDGLIAALETLEPNEVNGEAILSPSGNVKYTTLEGRNQTCSVCGEQMEYQTKGVTLIHPKSGSHSMAMDVVWIHTDCTDELVEGLRKVWDYSETILPEVV